MGAVNPARAGMIRVRLSTGMGMMGKPRASGDDPAAHLIAALRAE